ncbi:DUF1127 domain-containing protein [Pseudomonas sp. CrR25]|nr:DUF1127 domain-containing protein [Pseudomonas sp. CrR25]
MNGLSDVRLTLQREELRGASDTHQLYDLSVGDAGTVRRWLAFWRRLTTRRALLDLDDAQLKDVGLTRAEARREALRPFWTL